MTNLVELLACNIIERDSNGDVLWTWTYPSVSEQQRALIMRKCGLDGDHLTLQPFVYGRFSKNWYYVNCTEVFDSDNLPRVKQFALVLWTNDLNPEKYETLCRILSKTYCKTGNPGVMLQLYLSVVTRGSCTTEENGTFFARDFETRKNQPNTMLKELIQAFGLESILIYTALLLKKRIIVYHHSLEALLKQSDKDLQKQGLLKTAGKCSCCRVLHVMGKKRKISVHLGHILRCLKCEKTKSLAEGTFFKKTHLVVRNILLLMYSWATGSTVGMAKVQSGIAKVTVVQYFTFFRDIASWKIIQNIDVYSFVGPSVIVQVDDSVFTHRKYGRSPIVLAKWGLASMTPIEARHYSLCCHEEPKYPDSIRQQYVLPGSTIFTDEWAAYRVLDSVRYNQRTICHKDGYRNAEDGTYTNAVEGYWSRFKRFCWQRGWMRTFPVLMWHRRNYDILFPWIDLVPEELVDLKSNTCYIAGCRDSAVCSRSDLYDLLVNLPAREITIAPHAKESMTMTKTHKDIAVFMVQLAENENVQEQQLIKEIADKTRELLNQLRSLATVSTPEGKQMVSVETLREKNLPQALDNFLFNLAVAENIMML